MSLEQLLKRFAYLKEQPLTEDNVYKGKFLKVNYDTVKLPNGEVGSREYIKHPGASAVIAINDQEEVILEVQYRHSANEIMLEIPAGKLEINEDPLIAAQRELLEETGIQAKNWIPLGKAMPCIGYSDEIINYYLATELSQEKPSLDDEEFIEIITLPLNSLLEMAYKGEITDGKTLSGLMLYLGYTRNFA